jgi:hypothetical protein
MKYERPILYDLAGALTAEGKYCTSGNNHSTMCTNGYGAGTRSPNCNIGFYAGGCSTGSSANDNNCTTGATASGWCYANGVGAVTACSSNGQST